MIIKLTGCYQFKDYKVNIELLNELDRDIVKRVSKASFKKELHEIFEDYDNCLEAYKLGYLTLTQKAKVQDELFDKSGYSDTYDFFYDYSRWKVGLPIYIEFKLV